MRLPLNLYHIMAAVTSVTALIYLFNNIAVGYIPELSSYFFQRLMMTLHRRMIYVNEGAATKYDKQKTRTFLFSCRYFETDSQ